MRLVLGLAGQALILLLMCFEAMAETPRGRWETLGTLNLGSDSAPVTFRFPENNKKTTAIRLVAQGRAVMIDRIEIAYATGRVDFIDYRADPMVLAANSPSEPLAVREVEQIVETVTLHLRADSTRSTGQLSIAGSVVGEFKADATSTASQPRGSSAASRFVELDVYYATTRQRANDRVKNDIRMASFNGEQGPGITLGKAIVTVPKERDVGTIPRPYLGFVLIFRKEDPSKEFTLAKVDVLGANNFYGGIGAQAVDAQRFRRQALVFIHGFNVAFDDALYHSAQLAHDMAFDGPMIAFSWASRGNLLSYVYDRETARASRAALRDFLTDLAKSKDIDAVNIIAHSMGNDPLIEVLQEEATTKTRGGQPLSLKLKEVVFASPDVPRRAMSDLEGKLKALVHGGGTLYVSGKDIALRISDGLAHERAGYISNRSPPVIFRDVETIDMTNAGWMFGLNHSTFSERRHILDDLELLFSKGQRPPHERYKVFRPVDLASGQRYWRYER